MCVLKKGVLVTERLTHPLKLRRLKCGSAYATVMNSTPYTWLCCIAVHPLTGHSPV